jgi:formate dehydrogenase major subunit
VQGASDAGLIPMMFPNYQRVDNQDAHQWFEKFWNTKLDDRPAYTVVEIMHKALADDSDPHKIHGMYVDGREPGHERPGPQPRPRRRWPSSSTWWCRTSS